MFKSFSFIKWCSHMFLISLALYNVQSDLWAVKYPYKTLATGVLLLSLLELNLHKAQLPFTVCNTTLMNFLLLSNLILALSFPSLFLLMETPFFLVFSDAWSKVVMTNATFLSEKVWQSNTGYVRECQWLHCFKIYCLSTFLHPSSLPPPTFQCPVCQPVWPAAGGQRTNPGPASTTPPPPPRGLEPSARCLILLRRAVLFIRPGRPFICRLRRRLELRPLLRRRRSSVQLPPRTTRSRFLRRRMLRRRRRSCWLRTLTGSAAGLIRSTIRKFWG